MASSDYSDESGRSLPNRQNWEKEPFLPDDDHPSSSLAQRPQTEQRRSNFSKRLIFVHAVLFTVYIVAFVLLLQWKLPFTTSLHPINDLDLRFVGQEYTDFEVSAYAGLPSPELDKAWHDLLEVTTLRVSRDELARANQSSVELPGGGYMAWLGVYHELHCLWNYREHYHPGLKEEDRPHWDIHADHCIDVLRSAAMCHADTTLTTFGWADQPKPMLNTRPIRHKCANWDSLMDSVKDRIVSEEEMQMMVNPNLQGGRDEDASSVIGSDSLGGS